MPLRRALAVSLAVVIGASPLLATDVAAAAAAADAESAAQASAHEAVVDAFADAALPSGPAGTVPLVVVKENDGVPSVEVVHVDKVETF